LYYIFIIDNRGFWRKKIDKKENEKSFEKQLTREFFYCIIITLETGNDM